MSARTLGLSKAAITLPPMPMIVHRANLVCFLEDGANYRLQSDRRGIPLHNVPISTLLTCVTTVALFRTGREEYKELTSAVNAAGPCKCFLDFSWAGVGRVLCNPIQNYPGRLVDLGVGFARSVVRVRIIVPNLLAVAG